MMPLKTKTEQINTILDLIARTNRTIQAAKAANERLQVIQYERLKNQFLTQLTDLLDEETATFYVVERG
jgi:hypothetical protein